MKNSYFTIVILVLALCCAGMELTAQVSKEQALVALEQILKSEANRNFKKQITNDVQIIKDNSSLMDENTFVEFKQSYERLTMIYNRIYLAEMKLDLTSYRQLKKLGKKPAKKTKKYNKNYQIAVDHYTNNINPLVTAVQQKSQGLDADIDQNIFDSLQIVEQQQRIRSSGIQDMAASIGIVSSAFALVTGITSIIAERKRQNQEIIREFINEATYIFDEAKIPEWESLDFSELSDKSSAVTFTSAEEESLSTNSVPLDYAYGDAISGSLFFEHFDESLNEDRIMHISEGRRQEIIVNENEASYDLIVKRKPNSKRKKAKTHATPFVTSGSYGAGTFYRVRSEGNGYVYVFSLNSDQSIYSIFPFEGGVNDLPEGPQYNYPENAMFSEDESGNVQINIPDGEYYVEISDAPGKEIPEAETMIVLVSRPQLDIKDVITQMEGLGDKMTPEEKLFNIFGSLSTSVDEGNVYIENGTLYYSLEGDNNIVLPLVFGIKRH